MEGKLEGRRMKFFDYTGKKLVDITEYRKLVKSEINRVVNLPYDRRITQGWAGERKRLEGVLYEEDNLCHISGIGERTQKKIEKIAGINSVIQMSCINDEDALSLSIMCSLNIDRIKHWHDLCQDMHPGKCGYPIPFDFVHGQTNPYAHGYREEWETKINKVVQSRLMKVKCVMD
jgi:ribosomal protein S13